jgi:hypothetical protein
MKIEAIILTIFLAVLVSCDQKQNKNNIMSADSVTTGNIIIQDEGITTLDSTDTALGLGLVSINFDDKTTLHFYSAPNDKEPKRTVQFFIDETIDSWNIKDLDKHKDWLKPEILWLDYSQFVFRCLTVQDNWLKVIVNNETEETLWLQKSDLITFSDWENYLKGMFGVARLTDQKIRSLPNEHSAEIMYQGRDCFQVKSMKGDWIEIFTADYCDESYTDSKTKVKSGWIKWRQGSKLLIDYFTTS